MNMNEASRVGIPDDVQGFVMEDMTKQIQEMNNALVIKDNRIRNLVDDIARFEQKIKELTEQKSLLSKRELESRSKLDVMEDFLDKVLDKIVSRIS